MPIVISCPNPSCGRRYSVPDEAAGRTATCAGCGTKIQIAGGAVTRTPPAPASAAPTPPPVADAEDDDRPRRRRERDDEDDFDDRPVARRRQRTSGGGGGGFADFAVFRVMIAPTVLIILFWIAIVAVTVFGLIGAIMSAQRSVILMLGGLLGVLIAPIFVRIYFEIMIVVFRIFTTLSEIRDNTKA